MRFSVWPLLLGGLALPHSEREDVPSLSFERAEEIRGNTDITTDPRSRTLLSTPVALLALSTFATFVGFQLLLSVVPLYAGSDGGSSGAGLATAAFMLSTVLTQIRMPRLMVRFGYQTTLMAGMLFLGIPEIGRAHV